MKTFLWVSKMFILKHVILISAIAFCCFETQRSVAATLPQEEVDALNLIIKKMGATDLIFNADSCGQSRVAALPTDPEMNITCSSGANNTLHITALMFKRFNLPGELPREMVRLPFLEKIDFAYNYLNGTIPPEWASMRLKSISLLGNRLSGEIPSYLGNFTSLTYLSLELNQFSGSIPPDIGKLDNLRNLVLSSNNLSGNLPAELAGLNLTDFRINDNNFNGSIPDFIQNWKQLTRLEMQASGLKGPIPSSISVLEKLTDLRIGDIKVENQDFPDLSNIADLRRLVLRNCNISGEIPPYIWQMDGLGILDLSFNKLQGELPRSISPKDIIYIFLTRNFLSGNVPMFKKGINVDLSYNNFTRESPDQPVCQQSRDLSLNLFRSSSRGNDIGGACMDDFKCHQYVHSLYINCGGDDVEVNGTTYKGDARDSGGAATFSRSEDGWGLSSTGDFMDDNDFQNKAYVEYLQSANIGELYSSARLSPISLTYFHQCLENGNYTVSLHFAEIQFTNDSTYSSLGRRIFDIYIQNDLVAEDFNIEAEAPGALKPFTRHYNATVTNNILEIRFQWAGKGTTRVPTIGVYGPLINAITVVDPNYRPPSGGGKTKIALIVIGVVLGSCGMFLALGVLWWRHRPRGKNRRQNDFEGVEIQTVSFTLKQIKAATNNFDPVNRIGEGGFGPVYKGLLADGTVVAVKQLSSKSHQGNREFLNEIGMISCLQHPNLVKLHGCCIEGDQLLLVYEYMENNSLARALFGPGQFQLKLNWQTRQRICIGIAKGLAFLHEESRFKIVHRDIKGTNILLDKDLNPKISDFGLAKLDEEEKTHISTRIAGTIGYMAPEYALWGYLTYKADVYSFGIVALEIVSGKHNTYYSPDSNFACLLDWACHLQQQGNLINIVDENLVSKFNKVEAERMVKVALLCTNASPSLRPTMSDVVSMLEGTSVIPDVIPEPSSYKEDLRFKAMRDHNKQMRNNRGETSGSSSTSKSGNGFSSTSAKDLYEINEDIYNAIREYHNQDSQSQVSTSIPSATVSSSTSAHDLYQINA